MLFSIKLLKNKYTCNTVIFYKIRICDLIQGSMPSMRVTPQAGQGWGVGNEGKKEEIRGGEESGEGTRDRPPDGHHTDVTMQNQCPRTETPPPPRRSLGGRPLSSPSHEFAYVACERHSVFLTHSSVNSFDGHNLQSMGLGGDRWGIAQMWVRHVTERETEMLGR